MKSVVWNEMPWRRVVTSRARVWIEIDNLKLVEQLVYVTSRARVWIEMGRKNTPNHQALVTSRARVRIEMFKH